MKPQGVLPLSDGSPISGWSRKWTLKDTYKLKELLMPCLFQPLKGWTIYDWSGQHVARECGAMHENIWHSVLWLCQPFTMLCSMTFHIHIKSALLHLRVVLCDWAFTPVRTKIFFVAKIEIIKSIYTFMINCALQTTTSICNIGFCQVITTSNFF